MRIHLLHVNDVHSQLENYMRLGHLLRERRNKLLSDGEPVLTFDIGDVLDRVRPETEATFGLVNARMMAALGCDGWIFGNNEGLTIPPTDWPKLVAEADTAVFGTNLRQPGGQPFPYFVDYRILDCSGVRVGVFGLTADYVKPYTMLGVDATPPISAATGAVGELKRQGCQVIIALSHLGLRDDRTLAREVPGIDVILGGHSHHLLAQAEHVDNTAIFQAGKHAAAFGHTVIEMDSSGRVHGVTSEPVMVDVHGPLDESMQAAYLGSLPDVTSTLSRTIVHLDEPLPVEFDSESWFANVLADALFAAYPCHLALIMAGTLTASLLPGDVQLQDILGACSTPTRPLLLTLRGDQIAGILDKSIQPEYCQQPGFGYGFRGSVVGLMAVANASVQVEPRDDGRFHVREITVAGEPIVSSRLYRVVTCEYLWLAPVFPEFQLGGDVDFKPPLVRELLVNYLSAPGLLEGAQNLRYLFAPERK